MHRAFPKISGFIGKLKALSLYGVGVIAILWSIVCTCRIGQSVHSCSGFSFRLDSLSPHDSFSACHKWWHNPLSRSPRLSPQQIAKAYGINQLASRGTVKQSQLLMPMESYNYFRFDEF